MTTMYAIKEERPASVSGEPSSPEGEQVSIQPITGRVSNNGKTLTEKNVNKIDNSAKPDVSFALAPFYSKLTELVDA